MAMVAFIIIGLVGFTLLTIGIVGLIHKKDKAIVMVLIIGSLVLATIPLLQVGGAIAILLCVAFLFLPIPILDDSLLF
jgi:hypothetical protein